MSRAVPARTLLTTAGSSANARRKSAALFKKPNDLELEKVYMPYFLYSKKRYAAKLWEMGKAGKVEFKHIDVKGLSLVRRDNTPHVRGVLKELLDVILESSETDTPIKLARQRAIELHTGEVPNKDLILSAQLGDSYKNPNLAHVKCRDRMRERNRDLSPRAVIACRICSSTQVTPKRKRTRRAKTPRTSRRRSYRSTTTITS